MNMKSGQSTGPKTVEGKLKSSQNARKTSIFVKGLLPWEDQAEKQEQLDQLTEQWQAYDPSRQLILRTIEQCQLGLERMMYAERVQIEGVMQSLDIANEFCKRARFSNMEHKTLPNWYFMAEGAEWHKKEAILTAKAYSEAESYVNNYREMMTAEVAKEYPNLYKYALAGYSSSTIFINALGDRFKLATPLLNLEALIKEIEERYFYYLKWGTDHERYQAIVDGIRAEMMLKVMDLDKSTRYATNFQNRLIKAFTTLAAMDQHEERSTQRSLKLTEDYSNPEADGTIHMAKDKGPD